MILPTPPKHFVLFVCGIRSNTADCEWYDRAEEWVELTGGVEAKADSFRYETAATLRWWGQASRVDRLREKILLILGNRFKLTIVAHSNGCEMVRQALTSIPSPVLANDYPTTLHFIAPAVSTNFKDNGLNSLLLSQVVDGLHIHGSPDDEVLDLPARLSRWLTLGNAGYGDVGRVRPINVEPVIKPLIEEDYRNGMGHSSWFAPKHFDATMRLVTAHLPPKATL